MPQILQFMNGPLQEISTSARFVLREAAGSKDADAALYHAFLAMERGGRDMHTDIEGGMEDRGAEFDTAFAALISDLQARGLLDSTLVVVATEFGRKPQFDGSGRGHHPLAFTSVLAGAGVKRGITFGASDAEGGRVASNPLNVGDLHATIGWAAGLPIDKEAISPGGRPFSVGNKGKPVSALFA